MVNPVAARPYIYVTYNDLDITTPANKAEAYYVVSTDGGITWTAPAKVNDDAAGDQFMPTAAIITTGDRNLFGYYSRSHDPANLVFHRRARFGALNAVSGVVTPFRASFQLGADTPIVIGQDPEIGRAHV